MNTEKVLFSVYSEFMIFAEIYKTLDQDQIVTFTENVAAEFSKIDPDVLARYELYLKGEIERENARGAEERASALQNIVEGFEL